MNNVKGFEWSKGETKCLKEEYLINKKSVSEVMNILNEKFWKGKPVRRYKAVELKINRMGYNKGRHSSYGAGKINPKQKQIWELKKIGGYSDVQIAESLKIPVGTVKSTLNYLKEHTMLNEVLIDNIRMSKDDGYQKMQTSKELMNQISLLQKENNRLKAVTSIMVESMQTVIAKLPPIRVPEIIIKKGMHKPENAILELGDIHIGEKTVKGDVANASEYDFDKFVKRLTVLRDAIYECIDIHRSKIPINTLDINVLGDLVAGENIYIGQMRDIDRSLMEQVFEGAHELSEKLLTPMCKLFNKVNVRCVYGNHGRTGKPGEFSSKTNFDYISYRFLKQVFANQSNIEFFISECPLMLFKLPEAPKFTHLMSHGSEINSWMSIPFYGLQRDAGKYVQLFNMPIHYLHMGHFHNKATLDVPYGELLLNGNFPGGSDLSIFKMKTKSRPKQLLFGFNNTYGITWRYDIYLAPLEDMKLDRKGIYTPWNDQHFNIK